MGCRCCFVFNQLEELVDAGDSRSSSRVQEHESFWLFHNCMWQSRHPDVDVYVLALCEQTRSLFMNKSPCSNMICVCVFVCVFVLIWTFNRHWHTTGKQITLFFHRCCSSHVRNIFDFLNTRTGLLLWQNGSPCSNNWMWGLWLGLLGVFSTSSNFWTQLFHPIVFKGNLWRRQKWRMYFLVYDFSRFHHDSLRDTISWKRVVKNDCVRSCLIELKHFLLSKLMSTQYTVFWCFFHTFCLYQARRGAFKLISSGSLCSLSMGFTTVKNTVCLFLLEFCPPGINPEFTMECKLIAHPIWYMYSKKSFGIITLSCSEGSMGLRPEWPWRAWR